MYKTYFILRCAAHNYGGQVLLRAFSYVVMARYP